MLIPIILSGGAGTRLWPVSRELHPKPFIRFADGYSLLQKTFHRASQLHRIPEIVTVTNREHYFQTRDEYSIFNQSNIKKSYLLEPVGRDTAPAIIMAAYYVLEKYGREAVLLILPADHLIDHQENFELAVEDGYELAKSNKIITFGITPTSPEPGFGYIKFNKSKTYHEAYEVEAFIEKPSLSLAREFQQCGNYLWNSGIFCFNAETVLSELQIHNLKLLQDINACWSNTNTLSNNDEIIEFDAKIFREVEKISIDYALIEKTKKSLVVPCHFNWSDVGTWNSISNLIKPDEAGNRTIGQTLLIDVNNTFIQSNNRLVSVIGLNNLIIVDTEDALLVADRDKTHDIKKVVTQLKLNDHHSYKQHQTTYRPWGYFTILDEGKNFKIKRIVVNPGSSLSLQMHFYRSEHWIVVSGKAQVVNNDGTFTLDVNQSTFIPVGFKHRLTNEEDEPLVLIEVQIGDHLDENDIVRFEDQYGRILSE